MALLDNVLGGGDNSSSSESSHDFWSAIGTDPQFGVQTSDVLHSESTDDGGDSSSFTGIGDLGIGFAAPTMVGVNASSDQSNMSQQDDDSGGLLGGLI